MLHNKTSVLRMNQACLSLPLRGSSSLSRLSSPTMCCGLICSVRHKRGSVIKLQLQNEHVNLIYTTYQHCAWQKLLLSHATLSNSLSIVYFYHINPQRNAIHWETNAFLHWEGMFSAHSYNWCIVIAVAYDWLFKGHPKHMHSTKNKHPTSCQSDHKKLIPSQCHTQICWDTFRLAISKGVRIPTGDKVCETISATKRQA